MNINIFISTIILVLRFMNGIDGAPQSCATPGLYLSSDQNYCFGYIPLTRESHYHATICDGYATKIMSIDSANKQTMVETFLSDLGVTPTNKIWIGLANYLNDETQWVWYGGNITSYKNWATGEPAVFSRGNCVYMTAGSSDYKWRVDKCLVKYFGICEREATDADKP